jgi:hypothetical protein
MSSFALHVMRFSEERHRKQTPTDEDQLMGMIFLLLEPQDGPMGGALAGPGCPRVQNGLLCGLEYGISLGGLPSNLYIRDFH